VTTDTLAPQIQLDVPPDFHEVPLDAAVEDRVAGRTDLLNSLGLADPEQREGLGLYLEALARSLRDGPVAGTAFCAVELAGRPSTATLTVATTPCPGNDQLVVVAGIAEVLRAHGGYQSVQIERLGSHHGVVAVTDSAPAGPEQRQIMIAVPLPNQALAVLLTLATPHADDFATYSRVAREVAASARVVRSSPGAAGALLT